MGPAFDRKDYEDLKDKAHTLKGPSSYIGAGKLSYACYYIQYHFVENNYPLMMEYYPCVVEAAIEFKIYSRKIIAENESKLGKTMFLFSSFFPKFVYFLIFAKLISDIILLNSNLFIDKTYVV